MLRFLRSAAPILLSPLALTAVFACGGTTTEPDVGGAGNGAGGGSASGGAASTGGAAASGGSGSGTGGAIALYCRDLDCNGSCEGSGCGADYDWTCKTDVACTDDIAYYCGCDGVTFTGSGSCAPRAYSKKGPCDLVNCDPEDIICLPIVAPEPCPQGQVYSVVNNCHGTCVPISQCGCSSEQACPETEQYVCHNSPGHCDYYVH